MGYLHCAAAIPTLVLKHTTKVAGEVSPHCRPGSGQSEQVCRLNDGDLSKFNTCTEDDNIIN